MDTFTKLNKKIGKNKNYVSFAFEDVYIRSLLYGCLIGFVCFS